MRTSGVDGLLVQLKGTSLPEPAREVPFAGVSGRRRWRFDLAWPEGRIAVEYQGGITTGHVGHRGIAGMLRDHAKINEAQICGWLVLQANAKTVDDGTALKLIEWAFAVDPCRRKETTG